MPLLLLLFLWGRATVVEVQEAVQGAGHRLGGGRVGLGGGAGAEDLLLAALSAAGSRDWGVEVRRHALPVGEEEQVHRLAVGGGRRRRRQQSTSDTTALPAHGTDHKSE